MKRLFLAVACIATASAVIGNDLPARDENALTLGEAIGSTLQHNPQLTGYQYRTRALEGEQQTAALKPEYHVSAELENVAGTGNYSGVDGSEITLALSSIIELGGQRDARLGWVSANQQQLASEKRVITLDVLSEVTRTFISLVAAQERLALQQAFRQLASETTSSLSRQVDAGRTPEAELLRAKAALARADINTHKAEQAVSDGRLQLSAFWADTTPDFTQAYANLFDLPEPVALPDLLNKLDQNPDLAVLADTIAVRDAELRQAQSERKANLEWNAGIRQFQESDDAALVLGISLPLGTEGRAKGAITAASVNREGALHLRDTTRIQLQARLQGLYESYRQSLAEVKGLQSEVLPLLNSAMKSTSDAFAQGRYGYMELNAAQAELLDAQQSLIDAAVNAHETRIDIERITGSALTEKYTEATP